MGAAPSDQRVEVSALREPIEFPYARAYDAATKVRAASGGSAELVIQIADRKPVAAPLRVWLQYGETVEAVPVDPSNGFTIPPDPAPC